MERLAELLPDLQKILESNPDAVVAITNQGKPVMALLSWEDTEDPAAIMETLEVMAGPKTASVIRESPDIAGADDLVPGDVALQQLIAKGPIDPERR